MSPMSCRLVTPQAYCAHALNVGRVPHWHRAIGQLSRRIGDFLHLLPVVSLAVVVTLPISAPAQPGLGEKTLIQLALFSQDDLGFEHVNLAGQSFRHFSRELFFPK